jgi:hypothetical protein
VRAILATLLLSLAAAPAASTISGRVTEAGSDRPLARILVTLVASDGRELTATLTDGDGRYRFSGVAAGRYAISAAAGEHRSDHVRQWFGEKASASRWGRPPRYPLDVTDGSVLTGIDIAMLVALGIEGRVLSPWEEPMANVPVVAMRPDGSRVTENPVHTDDLGQFRLFGLAPGRYRVCAEAPTERGSGGEIEGTSLPFVQTCHPAAVNESAAADVTLTSSDVTGIDVRMQRTGGHTISGTVMDAAGRPADGATVMVNSMEIANRMGRATVRGGAFSIAGLVPGSYYLSAGIGGQQLGDPDPPPRAREMAFAEIDVTAVEATNLALMLRPAQKLRGRVVFAGTPPPGASQIARMLARATAPDFRLLSVHDMQMTAPVRDDLTFEFPEVYPLPLLLWMDSPPGWKVNRVRTGGRDVTYVHTDFTAARGPIEVTLTNRLARAIVHVVDGGGRSVNDAMVMALPAAAKSLRSPVSAANARGDTNGNATIGPLPAGDYLLVALTLSDTNLLLFDRARFLAVADVATMVTLRENESPRIELRLATLPEKR